MECKKCEYNIGVCQAALQDSKLEGCDPFTDMLEVNVSYEVCNIFIDQEGKEYETDDWTEEDVLIDVKPTDNDYILENRIINEILKYAENVATNIIIDEKKYDMLLDYDEEEGKVPVGKLRLKEMIVYKIAYDEIGTEWYGTINDKIRLRYKYND